MYDDDTIANLLQAWQWIECLQPQSVKTQSEEKYSWITSDDDPPWAENHPIRQALQQYNKEKNSFPSKVIHTVYVGLIPQSWIFNIVFRQFKPSTPDVEYEERWAEVQPHDQERLVEAQSRNKRDDWACAVISLNENGEYINESAKVSSAPWTLDQLVKYVSSSSDGEQLSSWNISVENGFIRWIDDYINNKIYSEKYPEKSLLVQDINNLANALLDELCPTLIKKNSELAPRPSWKPYLALVKSSLVKASDNSIKDEPAFINSFFLSDIGKAIGLSKEQMDACALGPYLKGRATDPVYRDNCLRNLLNPRHRPNGCWPGGKTANMSQQIAISSAVATNENERILAVNGPPGTGKTTILRDLVAATVTERAKFLMTLGSPTDAFLDSSINGPAEYAGICVRQELHDFGIILACANNNAAENVSATLPLKKTIIDDDGNFLPQELCDQIPIYFPAQATQILDSLSKEKSDNDDSQNEAWGLLAAVLGNQKNISKFHNTFMFWGDAGKDWLDGILDRIAKGCGNDEALQIVNQLSLGVLLSGQGTEARKKAEKLWGVLEWEIAKSEFEKALKAESEMRECAVSVYELFCRNDNPVQQHKQALDYFNNKKNEEGRLKKNVEECEVKVSICNDHVDAAKSVHDKIRLSKPNFFVRILHLSSFKKWKNDMCSSYDEMTKCNESAALAKTQLCFEQSCLKAATEEVFVARSGLNAKKEDLDIFQQAQTQWGNDHIKNIQYVMSNATLDDTEIKNSIEKGSPWSFPEWELARVKVFLAALQLHRSWIFGAAENVRKNIAYLFNVLSGNESSTTPQAKHLLPHAWATFLSVVPLVSTTFASVARMLMGMDAGTIGLMIVDEAGQATPQSAVGLAMRCRRMVVVGDPSQIEPVVTLPPLLIDKIIEVTKLNNNNTSEMFAPTASVQTFADSSSFLQTKIDNEHKHVGSPLLVHFRCDQPMFGISNEIAYNNRMIHKDDPISKDNGPFASKWWDIPAQHDTGHVDKNQIRFTRSLIEDVINTSEQPLRWFVIAPFRELANRLRKDLAAFGNVNDLVGTVHTFQGKEAELVVLVLGTGKNDNGARQWVGIKPNLVNVAVTRATKYLHVVGDYNRWSKVGHVSTLANALSSNLDDGMPFV